MVTAAFQSTLPRRERRAGNRGNLFSFAISIHAPAKGATKSAYEVWVAQPGFQSTLPRRERRTSTARNANWQRFQSTLPRRERPRRFCSNQHRKCYFNPRSREGSDAVACECGFHACISIHAPAKGATGSLQSREHDGKGFQSTLPRRERQHLLTSFRLQYGYSLFHLTNKI